MFVHSLGPPTERVMGCVQGPRIANVRGGAVTSTYLVYWTRIAGLLVNPKVIKIKECLPKRSVESLLKDVPQSVLASSLRRFICAVEPMAWPNVPSIVYHHVALARPARL